MSDCAYGLTVVQILNLKSLKIQQESDYFGRVGLIVTNLGWNEGSFHVLSSTSTQWFIIAVLDDCQFTSVKDHTNVLIAEIKFLMTTTSPRDFWCLVCLKITNNDGLQCTCHDESIFLDLYLVDFSLSGSNRGLLPSLQHLNHYLIGTYVVEIEFSLVPDLLHWYIEGIHWSTQGTNH